MQKEGLKHQALARERDKRRSGAEQGNVTNRCRERQRKQRIEPPEACPRKRGPGAHILRSNVL
jgi:hypothetical protein